jgi:hypothetical protein
MLKREVKEIGYRAVWPRTFALRDDLVLSRSDPVTFSGSNEQICSFLTDLDLATLSIVFHSCGRVHGISKQLESTAFTSKHSSGNRAGMQAY